jgi:hypothetical protein
MSEEIQESIKLIDQAIKDLQETRNKLASFTGELPDVKLACVGNLRLAFCEMANASDELKNTILAL